LTRTDDPLFILDNLIGQNEQTYVHGNENSGYRTSRYSTFLGNNEAVSRRTKNKNLVKGEITMEPDAVDDLRGLTKAAAGKVFLAPILLNLDYKGFRNIRPGDLLSWNMSIRQRSSPLSEVRVGHWKTTGYSISSVQHFHTQRNFRANETVTDFSNST
jgi:hypothetical protein